jgi:hypothetical protein
MQNMAEVIRLLHNLRTLPSNKRKHLTLLLLMSMVSAAFLTHIPRLTDDTALPRKDPSHFEEIQFKDHFRFRKQDFYRVLRALGMTVDYGDPTPVTLRIGKKGTQSQVASDWAFMVLLKRLSAASQYRHGPTISTPATAMHPPPSKRHSKPSGLRLAECEGLLNGR